MQDAKSSGRRKALGAFIMLFLVISTIGVLTTLPRAANAASLGSSNARNSAALGGTGATLPYAELKAYNATTNGTISGVSYTLGSVGFDVIDNQFVKLPSVPYVQFTGPQLP